MRKAQLILMTCCSVACLLLPPRASAQYFGHSYAIVVGIDHYAAAKWPTLHYAVKDARAMESFLQSQGFSVTPLYETRATKQAILAAMEDTLAPQLQPRDRVLVFFAGHGKTETLGGEKRGYIVPYDGDRNSSLISMEELREQSSVMGNARHELFIMDSCYGGLLALTRDSVVDPHMPHYLQAVTDRISRQVLTAGGENQEVVDGGPKGHSVFVDALLEGLQDGLADTSGDGYITFNQLVAYVTERSANAYQTPSNGVLPGNQGGEFLFKSPKPPGRPISEIAVPFDVQRRAAPSFGTAERPASRPLRSTSGTSVPFGVQKSGVGSSLAAYLAAQHLAFGNSRWPVGDWDGAIAQYREAIRLRPDYAEAHESLGNALSCKNDWDGEIREEREAIRLKPDYAEAHEALGVALSRKGDWDGEISEEHEAIRLKPDYAEAHADLGYALGAKSDWDGAIAQYRAAIRLKPDYAEAHEALGVALSWKGDRDGEIREEREAIRLKPDSANAHRNLAHALGAKGDWDGEISEEREAIRLKPDDADAHANLGYALGAKGDWDGEIREEREAIRLKPDYADAHANLGHALGQKGDWDGDIREERETIRLKPDYAEAYGNLAYALGAKGDWDEDIREEREAIRLKPNYAEAHANLGYAFEHKGDIPSALAEYRRALELNAGLLGTRSRYDRLLKQGNSPPR